MHTRVTSALVKALPLHIYHSYLCSGAYPSDSSISWKNVASANICHPSRTDAVRCIQVTSRREAKRLALSLFWNVRAEFSRRANAILCPQWQYFCKVTVSLGPRDVML